MIGNITDGKSDLKLRASLPSDPYTRMNNINILLRNVKECANAAESNMDPRLVKFTKDSQCSKNSLYSASDLGSMKVNIRRAGLEKEYKNF